MRETCFDEYPTYAYMFRCSACGGCTILRDEQGPTIWNLSGENEQVGIRYCPNCGAKVRGESDGD